MNLISNLSINSKILISPLILIFTLVFGAVLGTYGGVRMESALVAMNEIAQQRIELIDEFAIVSKQVQSDVYQIAVLRFMKVSDDEVKPIIARLEQGIINLNIIYGKMATGWELDDTEQALLKNIRTSMDEFSRQASQAVSMVIDDPAIGVLLIRSSALPFSEFQSFLNDFNAYQRQRLRASEMDILRNIEQIREVSIVSTVLLILASLFTTYYISGRLIAQPIREMTTAMSKLARGDMSIEVGELTRKDEIGEMARTLDFFRQTMIAKEQTENELVESQRMMAALLDNLPGFAYRCRNDRDWTMTFLSDGCLELTGYTPEELIENAQHPYNGIIHPDDREIVWKLIQDSLQKKKSFKLEYRITTASGDEKWVWEQGSGFFDEQGEVRFLEGYITEITEGKQAQFAQLEAYEQVLARQAAILNLTEDLRYEINERQAVEQELESKNRELESFVYTISHDLKAPLISLDGFSTALQKASSLDEKGQHYLERIRANTAHMSELITKLLELSRIGRVIGEPEKIDVSELLDEIISDLGVNEADSVIQVDEELPNIIADRIRIRQVFANLIDNAIKFNHPSRKLNVQIGCKIDENMYNFWVKDNGIGVATEHFNRIFEPFHQLNPGAQGVGMGLTLIKRIIEHHGGQIWAESQPDEGTTICFTLPNERHEP